MEIQALGLIEVKGFLGAIAASDAALKTADVKLINAEKIRGGLTTIQFSGDVAAVKVAVEAGSAAARELNCLLSSHVIPRLSTEASQMVVDSIHQKKTMAEGLKPTELKEVVSDDKLNEAVTAKEDQLKKPIEKKPSTKKADSSKKKT
ncbi:BMC domain-containing protein [Vagococcus sp. BWB3-3]|uniref:BMC domain-containing protein n=1 Tax=Vagococcus allomyrinae TaxID=2794353 RepID=A0A940P6V4_9ENTE|nr:BMC domain-containing protein [Vagococcus allomyrinae]